MRYWCLSLSFKEKVKFKKNIDTNETHSKKEKDDNVFELMLVIMYTVIIIYNHKKSEFKYFFFMPIIHQKFKL